MTVALTASGILAQENPYQSILARNVFGLKSPPLPPDPESLKPPPPKILLTGITTIPSRLAFLKGPPAAPKPGEPPAKGDKCYILAEGEREGDLEVVRIDEKAGSVEVINSGTRMTLTFEKDGPKLASSAPPGTAALSGPAAGNPAAGFGLRAGPAALRQIPSSRFAQPPMPGGSGAGAALTPLPGGSAVSQAAGKVPPL